MSTDPRVDIVVVIPTFKERDNVDEVIQRLKEALKGLRWEAIFVDDDSPDGTAALVLEHARRDPRIRLLHRVGRRGLSSACIEGILASSADAIAVMDGDLQHDETILPRLLERLRDEHLDVAVGTRNRTAGAWVSSHPGDLAEQPGRKMSDAVCHCELLAIR